MYQGIGQIVGPLGLHQYTARGLGQEDCVQYDEYGDCLEYEPSTSLSSLIDVTGYNPADWGQDLSNFFDFTPSSGLTVSGAVDASGAPLAGTFLSSSPTQPITIVPSSWGTSSANPSICSAAGCAADVANLLAGQQQILSGWGPQLQNWVSGNATILAISAAVFVGALLLIGGGGRRR
jgi:hypothetical protein